MKRQEHRNKNESISSRNFTLAWADWKDLAAETLNSNRSAITNHMEKANHVINSSGTKILKMESLQKQDS